MSASSAARLTPARRRLFVLLPLLIFLALAALFFFRLGAGDPSRIPSALIGRPAPETDMPPVARPADARRQASCPASTRQISRAP